MTNIQIDWVEIPAGKFAIELTAEQKTDLSRRLERAYGVDQLPEHERALLTGMRERVLDLEHPSYFG
jgi:hypothetical protein